MTINYNYQKQKEGKDKNIFNDKSLEVFHISQSNELEDMNRISMGQVEKEDTSNSKEKET